MPNARSVVAVRGLCGSNVPLQGANHAAVAGRLPVGLAVRHHDASFARSRLALFRYGGRCQVRLDPPQPCGSPRGDAPQPVRTNRISRSGCTTARVIDQACPAVACGGGGAPQLAVRELVGASQLLPPMCRWRRVQTTSIRCVTLAEVQDIPDCSPLTSIRCVTLARKCRHGHHVTTSICEGRVDVPASL